MSIRALAVSTEVTQSSRIPDAAEKYSFRARDVKDKTLSQLEFLKGLKFI
jgi:hypothetical protein